MGTPLGVAARAMAESVARRDPTEAVRMIVHERSDREPSLLRELAAARVGRQSYVVVELGDTPMVSAAVLAALRRLATALRDRGGALTVRSSDAGLARLMELTLLTLSFELEKSAPDAVSRAS